MFMSVDFRLNSCDWQAERVPMRVRKMSALVGAALILGGCLILYLMIDLAVLPSDVHDVGRSSDICRITLEVFLMMERRIS